jgi:squalene-associated FAD-dependent desaturase
MARLAVIGAGWAGLSAAVHAVQQGHHVTLMDMAHAAGGRARTLTGAGQTLDNGQHILIGAYRETLALMTAVGVDTQACLKRSPLDLRYPDGSGLALSPGPALVSFVWAVLKWQELPLSSRCRLLITAAKWQWQRFRCPPTWTVSDLCHGLPAQVMQELIEPLCVAALNTPADQASGQVLLTVLKDALFGPPGSADLLLPAASLQSLLPDPALQWLTDHGGTWRPGQRVRALRPVHGGWQIDGETFDGVVLATSAREAARLIQALQPAWAEQASALQYQPIITVWLRNADARWSRPMMALRADAQAPAQFGFDLGALGGTPGDYALVISGASDWADLAPALVTLAVQQQLQEAFQLTPEADSWLRAEPIGLRTEKRATFACTPMLQRPSADILPRLSAAGDYVAGPYPATLEGAVRSGKDAARRAVAN